MRANPNAEPNPTPIDTFSKVYPVGLEIMYVVMKKMLRMKKNILVKASVMFIISSCF